MAIHNCKRIWAIVSLEILTQLYTVYIPYILLYAQTLCNAYNNAYPPLERFRFFVLFIFKLINSVCFSFFQLLSVISGRWNSVSVTNA